MRHASIYSLSRHGNVLYSWWLTKRCLQPWARRWRILCVFPLGVPLAPPPSAFQEAALRRCRSQSLRLCTPPGRGLPSSIPPDRTSSWSACMNRWHDGGFVEYRGIIYTCCVFANSSCTVGLRYNDGDPLSHRSKAQRCALMDFSSSRLCWGVALMSS